MSVKERPRCRIPECGNRADADGLCHECEARHYRIVALGVRLRRASSRDPAFGKREYPTPVLADGRAVRF
jgi:hypothetical protein